MLLRDVTPSEFDTEIEAFSGSQLKLIRLIQECSTPSHAWEEINELLWKGMVLFLFVNFTSSLDENPKLNGRVITRNRKNEPFLFAQWKAVKNPKMVAEIIEKLGQEEVLRRLERMFTENFKIYSTETNSYVQPFSFIPLGKTKFDLNCKIVK